jgi:hypothetical protein
VSGSTTFGVTLLLAACVPTQPHVRATACQSSALCSSGWVSRVPADEEPFLRALTILLREFVAGRISLCGTQFQPGMAVYPPDGVQVPEAARPTSPTSPHLMLGFLDYSIVGERSIGVRCSVTLPTTHAMFENWIVLRRGEVIWVCEARIHPDGPCP